MSRFDNTYCSQCGAEFGPGNEGFSHCADHGKTPAAPVPDDLLDMAYINGLPQPFIGRELGGSEWPVHDFEVQTGLIRIDVCGKLQAKHIGDFTHFRDGAGVLRSAEAFYLDADKDERSAASTGADSGPHRSNDMNPASAPALSLPPQRLGSAMEGLPEYLREQAEDLGPNGAAKFNDWASEVEALRQRPGAQAASEPARELAKKFHDAYEELAPSFGYTTRPETRDFDANSANGRLMIATCQRVLIAGDHPASERPGAQAPSTAERDVEVLIAEGLKRHGYRQGTKECIAFFRGASYADETPLPAAGSGALIDALREAEAGLEFAGADRVEVGGFVPAPTKALAIVRGALRLAAPSTGGAETAEPTTLPTAAEDKWLHEASRRAAIPVAGGRLVSAPAQAVETATREVIDAANLYLSQHYDGEFGSRERDRLTQALRNASQALKGEPA